MDILPWRMIEQIFESFLLISFFSGNWIESSPSNSDICLSLKTEIYPIFPRPKPFERRTENRTFVRIHSDKWCYYPEFGSKSVFHSHFRCCMLLALEFIAVDVNRDNNTTLSMRMMTTAIASVMSEQIGYLMLIQRKCLLKNEIESSKYWRNKQRFQ